MISNGIWRLLLHNILILLVPTLTFMRTPQIIVTYFVTRALDCIITRYTYLIYKLFYHIQGSFRVVLRTFSLTSQCFRHILQDTQRQYLSSDVGHNRMCC